MKLHTEKLYKLELSEKDIRWLKFALLNPIDGKTIEEESQAERTMRYRFINALQEKPK